jgi:Skp family chaperone for outer membrane proteins
MSLNRNLLSAGMALVLLFPMAALAQGVHKVGTLSVLRAIGECVEGKAAMGEFQKKVDAKQEELQRKNGEIQGLQKQLQDQQRTLNDESKAALSKTIETRNTELQRATEDARKEFTDMQNEIFNQIGRKLMPVLQQYAKENNFAVIVDSSSQTTQLVYADPAIDITDDLIKRFDATQPASAAPAPTGAKPAAPPASTGVKPAAPAPTKAPGTPPKP